MDDARRATLVEEGLLQSNSDTLQYVSQHTLSVITHVTLTDR